MALMASNGILIDVNAAFSQQLHMPADMLIQQSLIPYLHPADVEIYQQGLAQLRTVGNPPCQLALRLVDGDGQVQRCLVSLTWLSTPEQISPAIACLLQNSSDAQVLKPEILVSQHLRQTLRHQREQSQFAANRAPRTRACPPQNGLETLVESANSSPATNPVTMAQLRQDVQHQQALNEISQTILGATSLDTVLSATLQRVARLLAVERVSLWQYHRNRQVWLAIAEEPQPPSQLSCLGQTIPATDDTFASPLLAGQTVCIDSQALGEDAQSLGAWMAVPLAVNGCVWGALALSQEAGTCRQWSHRHRDLVAAIAAQLSLAIQQNRLYRQIQQQAERQAALNRVLGIIRDSLDLQQVFTNAAQEALALLQVERVLICEYQTQASFWRVHVDYCPGVKPIHTYVGLDIPDSDNPMMTPLKQGQVLRVDHPETSPIMTDDFLATLVRTFPGGWMILPLQVGATVWGKFICIQKDPWQDWQQELAINVADKLAIAIQQSVLYQQLQDMNRNLEVLAMLDGLTQIPNRRYFDQYLQQEWGRAQREGQPISLILADVDFFKAYNDTYGHQAGDDCLMRIAQALQAALQRPGDLVARYGGEEFALVLPNTRVTGAVRVAEAIQAYIAEMALPHSSSPVQPQITLSLGITCLQPAPDDALTTFLAQADQALYAAKQQGRDRYCIGYP
jgi:diguanylate cyclase (GGDEF)-like protein